MRVFKSIQVNTYHYINYQDYGCTLNSNYGKKNVKTLHTNDTNTNRGVIDFFQGELIFLFIISISLHNLRTVSGFFL